MASTALTATSEMCFYVFDCLINALDGKKKPKAPSSIPTTPCLLFVTYRYGSSPDYERNDLRGCKGTTANPKPLPYMLHSFALNSAFDDRRFNKITKREVPKLHCGVNLLHSFEPAQDCYDWEVGVHGILIDIRVIDQKTKRTTFESGAIYLPSVAVEQGWNKQQTVKSLVRKAGWNGHFDLNMIEIVTTR
mmetsp:Transcript_15183/g.16882  ORF Transcript_15183/g.16882 Transcript_15183/m.16882 type:complete len:191 (+) Transcript_15183:129-701(+)